jgi:hypothetical protein
MSIRTIVAVCLAGGLALLTEGCGSREFAQERDVVEHFQTHRSQFRRAAELFEGAGLSILDVPAVASGGTEPQIVRLCRELRVRHLSRVPGVKEQREQWIEFRLPQRLLRSTYGVLFVPEGHEPALDTISFLARSPSHGIRAVRPIEGRWFYYDYD